jgi:protein O-mannosyl-transferase
MFLLDIFKKLTSKQVFVLFFVLGFIVYGNSLLNPFIADDIPQILNNPLVHDMRHIPKLFSGSTFYSVHESGNVGIFYRPVMMTIFNIFYSLFGPNPSPFHLLQITLHIVNAFLIFVLLRKFLSKVLAVGLAILFLVHPINSETVVYIADLQDVLFVFFGLFALRLLILNTITKKKVMYSSLLLLLSLFSKETGFLFILMSIFYFYLFNKKHIKEVLTASLVIVGIYSYFRFIIANIYFGHQDVSPIVKLSLIERLGNIPKIIFHYFSTLIYPKDLVLSQQWVVKNFDLYNFYLPLFIICLAILVLGFLYFKVNIHNRKIYLFFIAWVTIGMLIISQIYPLDMTVAERWFYFPIIGVLGVSGVIMQNYSLRLKKYVTMLSILFILINSLLSIRTIVRNYNWSKPLTLYEHDTKINKDSYTLENEYGYTLAMQNKIDEAEQHFKRSIELAPDWYTNWSNLGVVYFKKGDTQKAKQYLKVAIKNGDDNAYLYLATIYIFYDHDYKTAEKFLLSAIKKFPQSSMLWQQLALAEYGLGNKDKALQAAKKSFAISPTQVNFNLINDLTNNVPIDLKTNRGQ